MNRSDARKIAEIITNEELQEMFNTAKSKITNWEEVSRVNRGMTKGVSWNILTRDFNVNKSYHILAKTNMVREFGQFLPDRLKPSIKKKEWSDKPPIHQEPIF